MDSVLRDREDLELLEAERCRAISELDLGTLDRLLAPELTHTHVTGRTQGKAEYLAGLAGRPRRTTRADLTIRLYGEVAIMTGSLLNEFPSPEGRTAPSPPTSTLQATQVWVRSEEGWRLAAFAASGGARADAAGRREDDR